MATHRGRTPCQGDSVGSCGHLSDTPSDIIYILILICFVCVICCLPPAVIICHSLGRPHLCVRGSIVSCVCVCVWPWRLWQTHTHSCIVWPLVYSQELLATHMHTLLDITICKDSSAYARMCACVLRFTHFCTSARICVHGGKCPCMYTLRVCIYRPFFFRAAET